MACARAEQAGKRREKKDHFDAHAQKEKERMLPAEDAAFNVSLCYVHAFMEALKSQLQEGPYHQTLRLQRAWIRTHTWKRSKRYSASLLDVLGREQALEPSKCTKTSHLNNQFLHTISAVRTNINLIFKLQLYSACFCCLVEKTSTNKFAHYTGGALGETDRETQNKSISDDAVGPVPFPPAAGGLGGGLLRRAGRVLDAVRALQRVHGGEQLGVLQFFFLKQIH